MIDYYSAEVRAKLLAFADANDWPIRDRARADNDFFVLYSEGTMGIFWAASRRTREASADLSKIEICTGGLVFREGMPK